jgi:hypothetical protein
MEDILVAKRELFEDLKRYSTVVGVAVKKENNIRYIVVYLSKLTSAILRHIPKEFKGNQVKYEVKGPIGIKTFH